MNDEEIERRLQSQRGPREDGYTPIVLPASVDAGGRGDVGARRLMRSTMLVAVAVAGVLAVALVGGMLSRSLPGIGDATSAPPSPSASAASPGGGTCERSDLTLTAEPWGGAAGSRGTIVTIVLASGRPVCVLPPTVSVQIQDANGTRLVGAESVVTGATVSLEPGAAFTGGLAWSNWCGSDPAVPVTVALRLGSSASWVPVDVAAGGLSPIPPCLGNGQTMLSVTEFQLRP